MLSSLGMAQGYVFGAIGPVMLSACISCVVFKEIRGTRNLGFLSLAIVLSVAGCVMIGLSKA